MFKLDLLNRRYKKAKGKLTNQEVCKKTGLKNYELSKLEQNDLEITWEIHEKLNKLDFCNWYFEGWKQKLEVRERRLVISLITLTTGILASKALLLFGIGIFILSETIFETSWFYFCKRRIKSWMKS